MAKIAIIGGGIAGLTSAYYLQQDHAITLFEADTRLGGHTDTHAVDIAGQRHAVDTGFIVFNYQNYPCFSALLDDLGVESRPTDMSFAVSNRVTGLEYKGSTLASLFCQRSNLIRPQFYRMLADLVRFYRQAPKLLERPENDRQSLESWLSEEGYSRIFTEQHIYPMACALWSANPAIIGQYPARYFVAFMHNHRMLNLTNRPQWRTVVGGSQQYVQALQRHLKAEIRLGCPVDAVSRQADGITLNSAYGKQEQFDYVIFACHSDQALRILQDPSQAEQRILGNIPYQENDIVLHTDSSLMPHNRNAWSSWNALVFPEQNGRCTVSYDMNQLQGIHSAEPLIVTLNCRERIDPDKIILSRTYHHPVYHADMLQAQLDRDQINGQHNTFYCGAYWGWGFHEDGARSAMDVVNRLRGDARNAGVVNGSNNSPLKSGRAREPAGHV